MTKKRADKKAKKRPGRPPQSGAYSLIVRGGELPKRRTYLRAYLQNCRDGLIEDLGPGEEDLTTAQRVLIDRAISKLGIVRCIEESVKEGGAFKGKELSSVLAKSYITYCESIRRDLEALGISKRAGERVLSPLEIAAEIDAGKAEAGQGAPAGPVAASAGTPECPGKGIDGGAKGDSRGECEKRRSESPAEPQSLGGDGQEGPGAARDERSQADEGTGQGGAPEGNQAHE